MPLDPLPVGTILDRKFKITAILGVGGMGTVYKVEQVDRPGYFRAVKELLLDDNTTEEERKSAIERFNKEIDLLYNLKHPRIPSLILDFQERGRYYFVMEFVSGRSLEKILETANAPLDEDTVIRWMMMVCEALTYIHTRTPPIILRDLKPGNIMVTDENDVFLIDFGIARRWNPNKKTNTENLGTISYASPEHLGSITGPGQRRTAQNPGKLAQTDARSDIYSLGATMYHLLTNQEPEPIQTPAPGSILAKNPRLHTVLINGKFVSPTEQIIIKAMQFNPAQRFQTAEAMRVALQHCLLNAAQAAPTTIQIPAVSPNATILVPAAPAATAAEVVCPKCGYYNRPGAKFCKRDGQPLTQGAITVPPQVRAANIARSAASVPPAPRAPIIARQVQPPLTRIPAAIPGSAVASNDPQTAYRLGLQFLNNKQYAEAIGQFKLAQTPGLPTYDAQYNLGRAYRQYAQTLKNKDKNQFTEELKLAAECFEKAIALKPDASDVSFQLGMTYNDLELYEKASSVFSAALTYSPKDSAIYYQLGYAASKRGFNREAEGYYLEGLKINPDHALILLSLGRLYMKTNQIPSAISVLRQATQRDPVAWEGWLELGRAHMKARQWKVALSALEQARQWNPDESSVYSAMATCYLRTNNKTEARRMMREALQRDPNNAEANRLQKQL
jgi:tetratricopeptide (TPR) repeat protein/predicted Ser/Thr protein kinase